MSFEANGRSTETKRLKLIDSRFKPTGFSDELSLPKQLHRHATVSVASCQRWVRSRESARTERNADCPWLETNKY